LGQSAAKQPHHQMVLAAALRALLPVLLLPPQSV
jgi:hypothetical protein